MNGYELSRKWFDYCFDNPEKIKPNHSALYFFAIEHCNRLGWKEKFGFPTEMAKDAIGIKNYKTYINTLNDLVEFGFIKMIERSKNQYSANIIALVNYTKATTKALDKASTKHSLKQVQSIDSIDKPLTNKPVTVVEKTFTAATDILKLLNDLPEDKISEIKQLTLFSGNLIELKQKFAVEFVSRYGLNKTEKEVIETFQSWMHRDKNYTKPKNGSKKYRNSDTETYSNKIE